MGLKCAIAAVALTASSAAFGQLEPSTLPAGLGCTFPLVFQPLAAGHQAVRVERVGMLIIAGQFGTLQISNGNNLDNSLVLPGKGANFFSVDNGDGTQTWTFTGHWVISWFPTDTPAGPKTIEYVGRLVVRQSGSVSTLISLNGKEVLDICAALS
jgi:hypothetical protein